MTQQTSPFVESKYGWNFGESGWNTGADENWLKFGFLHDNNVEDVVASLPTAINGTAYFLTTDNRFYFAVGTSWYSSPCPKWFIFKVRSTGMFWQFDGASAVEINNPQQANAALEAIQDVIDTLGTAAFVSLDSLATQAELDVAAADAAAYTDDLRDDLGSTVSGDGSGIVGFIANGTGALGRSSQSKLRELGTSIVDFGAVGDGVTDDSAAEDEAHAARAGKSVVYPPSTLDYLNTDNAFNLYGASGNRQSLGDRIQSGLNTSPATAKHPVLWVQKFGDVDRTTIEWDQGAAYFGLIKKGGTAPGVSTTIYGLHQGADDASIIGLHSRVKLQSTNAGSDAWAGWFYCDVDQASMAAAHGLEINGFVNPALGLITPYLGTMQMVRLVMADSSDDNNRFSTALSIGRNTVGGTNNGVWTGIHFEAGSIISSNLDTDNGECIRLDGPVFSTQKIGGMRLVSGAGGTLGTYRYGFMTSEATFSNNNVFIMATGQNIRWGNITTGVKVTGGTNNMAVGNGFINITDPVSDTAIQVSSVKVLGARKTGWTADTGTAKRTANTTYSGTAEVSYTQATIQALMDAVAANSQTIKALKDDMISHGLIGA